LESNRIVGIHLRIEKSYTQILETALQLDASTCQFFFMPQESNKYLRLSKKDLETFLELSRKHFSTMYCHSSYWINPATGYRISASISRKMFLQEIKIANKLEIDHFVLHAGSAKGYPQKSDDPQNKNRGIAALAKLLNDILKDKKNITVLIENTAHSGKTICSNLQDFKLLRSLLDVDNVAFCLDTTHAFSYGYNLEATEEFVELLNQTMGLENIKLIHLNDSTKKCGSKIDQHILPGKGVIGKNVLQNLINHPKLKHLPIIIEPPVLPEKELKTIINEVRTW